MMTIGIILLFILLVFNSVCLYKNIKKLNIVKIKSNENKIVEKALSKRESQCKIFFEQCKQLQENADKEYNNAKLLKLQHEDKQKELNTQISNLNAQRIELLQKIEEEKAKINSIYRQEKDKINKDLDDYKKTYRQCCEQYGDTLEQAYQKAEEQYKNKIDKINAEIAQCQHDLDEIRHNRAAAQEAIRKEQEVKAQHDFYSLQLTEAEKKDISLLNSIKDKLLNSRPVNMVIWQSYYSKKANELCSRILGTNKVTGIYKITNLQTDQVYIGQAKDIKERLREHMKCGLGIDVPNGNKLYEAMLSSSLDNFTFELIEKCPNDKLNERELYYISLYQSYDYGYNSNKGIKK